MPAFVWVVASYLVGSIPAALLAGRWLRGVDLRDYGSGNLGATNVLRVLGAGAAFAVLAFDMAKGLLPVLLFPRWTTAPVAALWPMAYGVAAIVGHIRPLYLRGKGGGKGVATATGAFLGLAPIPVLLCSAIWSSVLALTSIVSLASVSAALALPVAMAIWYGWDPSRLFGSAAVAAFVVYTHRANLARLRRGDEPRIGEGSAR